MNEDSSVLIEAYLAPGSDSHLKRMVEERAKTDPEFARVLKEAAAMHDLLAAAAAELVQDSGPGTTQELDEIMRRPSVRKLARKRQSSARWFAGGLIAATGIAAAVVVAISSRSQIEQLRSERDALAMEARGSKQSRMELEALERRYAEVQKSLDETSALLVAKMDELGRLRSTDANAANGSGFDGPIAPNFSGPVLAFRDVPSTNRQIAAIDKFQISGLEETTRFGPVPTRVFIDGREISAGGWVDEQLGIRLKRIEWDRVIFEAVQLNEHVRVLR